MRASLTRVPDVRQHSGAAAGGIARRLIDAASDPSTAARATLVFLLAAVTHAAASDCRPCAFGGLCRIEERLVPCVPSRARCRPNGGILVFNSVSSGAPAYWTLVADARGAESLGRLDGRLEVWADYTFPRPAVPGLPAECATTDRICFGASARFSGTVRHNRLRGVARYADAAACEFRGRLLFGLGSGRPNRYLCRGPSGDVVSKGPFRVQGIRLTGCRR
jgi:hypothetical protein